MDGSEAHLRSPHPTNESPLTHFLTCTQYAKSKLSHFLGKLLCGYNPKRYHFDVKEKITLQAC